MHCSLLEAVCRLLSKYPANVEVFRDSCRAVLAIKNSLPLEITGVIHDVQKSVLLAVSRLVTHRENMSVVDHTLNLLILLWNRYPKQLPVECDMEHFSSVLVAGLDIESHGEKTAALRVGQDFVRFMMRSLSDGQLQLLGEKGFTRKFCSLLTHHEDMESGLLQQLVVGVGILAEVKLDVQEFVGDNVHVALLFAAQEHFSHAVLPELIWRLLGVVVQRDVSFVKELTSSGLLPSVAAIMEQEGFVLLPVVRFLTLCCHRAPNPFIRLLLENKDLMGTLLRVVDVDTEHGLESVTHTCDFLAYLCSKVPPRQLGLVVDLAIVSRIKSCARRWPEACLLQACLAIEGLCTPFPPGMLNADTAKKREEFFEQDHHIFAKDMLCDSVVSQSSPLVELIYVLLQKLLRASPPSALQRMAEREFVEALVMLFARDTFSLPQQANRIAFTLHYFVFQMKAKECFEYLRDLCFHTFVVDLIQGTGSYEVTATAMGLLASLLGKYYNHFKSVSALLDTQLPELLIHKCAQYKARQTPQFGDDFGRILLNLTADRDMSLQLHKRGYMDMLLEVLEDEYAPVIRRSVIHSVGNISLGSQTIKQELHERQFDESLLHILETESERGDVFLLCACCRVLHILASGDRAKRKFVERGCIPLLLGLMKKFHRGDTKLPSEEVAWRSLSLLGSLGFIAVTNRRNVLTSSVIGQISEVLRNSKNGKVISYAVLIFLGAGELDEAAVQLRELQVDQCLLKAMENKVYKVQAPDLSRWCSNVLEKEYLYTLFSPPEGNTVFPPLSPSLASEIDWPHHLLETDASMETDGGGGSGDECRLLPLEEEYMVPQYPVAPSLSPGAKEQLRSLGLDPEEPLFRLGRVYGSTHGFCSNCDRESVSEELVIRPHSLTPHQYQELIDAGWYRRGGVKLFRLRCNHNVYHADWETHVNALEFDPRSHKSYRRVLKRMPEDRLTVETLPTHFDREAFDLYNTYHIEKHDKPFKSMFSYTEHVVNSPIQPQTVDGVEYGTFHQLYRLDGELVAIGIIDVVPKGIVSIYMWYDIAKSVAKYSFGVYSALKEIELVCQYHERNPSMQNYYLQGWNKLNKKLAYKSNYSPEYFYCPTIVGEWVEGEEGVERSQEAYIQSKKDCKGEKVGEDTVGTKEDSDGGCKKDIVGNKTQDVKGTLCNSHGHEGREEDMDTADSGGGGGCGDSGGKNKPPETDGVSGSNCSDTKDESSSASAAPPAYSCEAYPIDLARYTARTGESEVDIGKIVVCLNYSEYRRLGEVLEQYHVAEAQRKILEQRLAELVVTLSPGLLAQLVIDFKVCRRPHGRSSESPTVAVLQESGERTRDTEALAV